MSPKLETLESEVLRLPVADRVRLLDRVVASLDVDAAREAAWDDLAAQRDAKIEAGSATETSVFDVVARLEAELK